MRPAYYRERMTHTLPRALRFLAAMLPLLLATSAARTRTPRRPA